jgi:hypothetical protein
MFTSTGPPSCVQLIVSPPAIVPENGFVAVPLKVSVTFTV